MTEPRPAADPLAEAALRPLADQPAAREDAANAFRGIARSNGDPAELAARWEKIPRSSLALRGPWIWLGLCALVSLLALLGSRERLVENYRTFEWLRTYFLSGGDSRDPSFLRQHDHPLIHDHDLSWLENAERLPRSDPENPAYLAAFASTNPWKQEGDPGRPWPEVLETAARIDPDNAFFPILVAGKLASEAVRAEPPDRATLRSNPRASGSYVILDPERIQEALALLE